MKLVNTVNLQLSFSNVKIRWFQSAVSAVSTLSHVVWIGVMVVFLFYFLLLSRQSHGGRER